MKLKKKVKVILVIAILLIVAGLGFIAYESVKPKAVRTPKSGTTKTFVIKP